MKIIFTFVLILFLSNFVAYSQSGLNAMNVKIDSLPNNSLQFSYPRVDLEDLAKNVQEVYTPEMVKNNVEGKVIIRVLVDYDGEILKNKIITSPSEEMSLLALSALKKSKITPAYKDGNPIGAWANFPIEFKIKR